MVSLLMLQGYLLVLSNQYIRYVYGTVYSDSLICLVLFSSYPLNWSRYGICMSQNHCSLFGNVAILNMIYISQCRIDV